MQDACPVWEPFSVVGPKHARTYVSTSSCPRVVHVCVRSPGVGAGAEEGGARESQAGAGDKTHRHWGCAGGPGDGGQAETPGKVAHRVERLAGDGAPCRGERDTHTRSLVPRRCRGRAHARRRAHTPSTRTAQLQYPAPGVWSAGIVANVVPWAPVTVADLPVGGWAVDPKVTRKASPGTGTLVQNNNTGDGQSRTGTADTSFVAHKRALT